MSKRQIVRVELLWSENLSFQQRFCGPVRCNSLARADTLLRGMAATVPRNNYDRTAFRVVWDDGEVYEGRYDLKHASVGQSNRGQQVSLSQHIRDHLELHCGRWKPPHTSKGTNREYLHSINREYAARCERLLDNYELDTRCNSTAVAGED